MSADDETNVLDRLLANHETDMLHLALRWNLGRLQQRSAEATPPKRHGEPFTGIIVRFFFARGVVTWREDTGHIIERTSP